MRIAKLAFAVLGSLYAFSAAAQGWIEFVEREELFGVNLPHAPAVEEITYLSEFHAELPGRVILTTSVYLKSNSVPV